MCETLDINKLQKDRTVMEAKSHDGASLHKSLSNRDFVMKY